MNLKNLAMSALMLGAVGTTSAAVIKNKKDNKQPTEVTQNITHKLSGADYVNYVMPQKVKRSATKTDNSVNSNYYYAVGDFSDLTHENRVDVLTGVVDSLNNVIDSYTSIRKCADKSVYFTDHPTGESLLDVADEIVSNPYTKKAFLNAVKNYDRDAEHYVYKFEELMTNKGNNDSVAPADKLKDILGNMEALLPVDIRNAAELLKDLPSDATVQDLIYLFGDYAHEMYETSFMIGNDSLKNDVDMFDGLNIMENTGAYQHDVPFALGLVGSKITDFTKNVFVDKVEQAKTELTSVEKSSENSQPEVKMVKTDKGVFIIKTAKTSDGIKTETFDLNGNKVANLNR